MDSLRRRVMSAQHEYVEIGGIKWALCNLGANNPWETGLYFQWGDTQGYTASQVGSGSGKKYFYWEDCKYGNGASTQSAATMTKYNSSDGKTVLEASDDAATFMLGGNWRMPTIAEYNALFDAVNVSWETNYQGTGVNGLLCTDKTNGSKKLFFPAVGYVQKGNVYNVGVSGNLWSASLISSDRAMAHDIRIGDTGYSNREAQRFFGFNIRAILDE